jgi:hypothetical protein
MKNTKNWKASLIALALLATSPFSAVAQTSQQTKTKLETYYQSELEKKFHLTPIDATKSQQTQVGAQNSERLQFATMEEAYAYFNELLPQLTTTIQDTVYGSKMTPDGQSSASSLLNTPVIDQFNYYMTNVHQQTVYGPYGGAVVTFSYDVNFITAHIGTRYSGGFTTYTSSGFVANDPGPVSVSFTTYGEGGTGYGSAYGLLTGYGEGSGVINRTVDIGGLNFNVRINIGVTYTIPLTVDPQPSIVITKTINATTF